MPDPKLQMAMEEIKAIIQKHDLSASVLLQNQTHGEFFYELSPSWSCITLTTDGQIGVKCKAKTGGDDEKERLRVSVGLIMGILDHARKQEKNMSEVVELLIHNGLRFNHFTREE